MLRNPNRFAFFLTGNAETNKRLTDIRRRLRLHHTAKTTVTLMNAGITVFPDEKPHLFDENPAAVSKPSEAAFYYSREMKSLGIEHLKIRNSRSAGMLFTEDEILLIYNTGKNLMKWEYQTELRCKALMNSRFCQDAATAIYTDINTQVNGLMLGSGIDMALALLTSAGGYHRQYFRLDGTFERLYYAPDTPEGEAQVRIICSGEVRKSLEKLLLSDLLPGDPGLRIEHDAFDHNGIPVLLAFDFDLERIRRFRNSAELLNQTGRVICFEFQEPVLEKYLGPLAEFQTISLEKVEGRFFNK